jgi:hypothetical protein
MNAKSSPAKSVVNLLRNQVVNLIGLCTVEQIVHKRGGSYFFIQALQLKVGLLHFILNFKKPWINQMR